MAPQPDHPPDPLTAEEIELARDVLVEKRDLGERDRFLKIDLEEPAKEDVLSRNNGDADVPREAYVEIRDSAAKKTYEAVVSRRRECRRLGPRPRRTTGHHQPRGRST